MGKSADTAPATSIFMSISAVNLDTTVFDTNDLSTVRGSSLALLEATKLVATRVRSEFGGRYAVTPIREGASELTLQLVPAVPDGDGRDVAEFVRDLLTGTHQLADGAPRIDLGQFIFTVATERAKKFNDRTVAALQARGRTRQYERLSVTIPEAPAGASGGRPCALGRIKAGTVEDGGDFVSSSVAARRRFGRHQRSRFYHHRLREAGAKGAAVIERLNRGLDGARLDFAQSFEELGAGELEARELGLKVALQGKIGIIHLDGNGFGALARQCYDNAAKLSQLSVTIRRLQAELLADVLNWLLDRSDHMASPVARQDGGTVRRLRFETLLWGGDEMTFAVPAWAAFDLLDRIMTSIEPWRLPPELGDKPLRHKVGMLVADRKLPVARLKSIADDLARSAKTDDERTNVHILSLAGADIPDGSVTDLRRQQFGFPASVASIDRLFDLVPPGGSWRVARDQLQQICDVLPPAFVHGLIERYASNFAKYQASAEVENDIRTELKRVTSVAENRSQIEAFLLPQLSRGSPTGPFGYSQSSRLLPLLQLRSLAELISPLGPGCRPNPTS